MFQEKLLHTITDSLMKCPKSVFIFDEFEKMPPKLVRTIAAFLEPVGRVGPVKTG